jgi:hypothetical protein
MALPPLTCPSAAGARAEAPKGRRDEFVEPYFKGAEPDEVVVVLKAREPARIKIAILRFVRVIWMTLGPSDQSTSTVWPKLRARKMGGTQILRAPRRGVAAQRVAFVSPGVIGSIGEKRGRRPWTSSSC